MLQMKLFKQVFLIDISAGMLGVSSPHGSRNALHHFSVDCSHAHRGLFAGILIIVLTIISLIMFFVLANNPATVIVSNNTFSFKFLLSVSPFLITVIFFRMPYLK